MKMPYTDERLILNLKGTALYFMASISAVRLLEFLHLSLVWHWVAALVVSQVIIEAQRRLGCPIYWIRGSDDRG